MKNSGIRNLAALAYDWGQRCFGRDHMANKRVRALRHGEEAVELMQALGVEKEVAMLLIEKVYAKPPGAFYQELGGSLMTALVLCESFGLDPEEVVFEELRRVLAKPAEHFQKRNLEKIEGGLK